MNSNTIRGSAYESVLYWKRASVRTTHLQIQSSKDITGVRLRITAEKAAVRGGSWCSTEGHSKCSKHHRIETDFRYSTLGFRLAIR